MKLPLFSTQNFWPESWFLVFFFMSQNISWSNLQAKISVLIWICLSFCSDFHCSRIMNKKLILFANKERTNEQLTDFVFTPKLYLLNYNSNLFHIFPILFQFYVISFIEELWIKTCYSAFHGWDVHPIIRQRELNN